MDTTKQEMATVKITSPIRCNRCDKHFPAPRPMKRDGFCGTMAARIQEVCTCPYCQQTDWHWVYASDIMPPFEGNLAISTSLRKQWLAEN